MTTPILMGYWLEKEWTGTEGQRFQVLSPIFGVGTRRYTLVEVGEHLSARVTIIY